jgi:Flp pilus assembly protein TadG
MHARPRRSNGVPRKGVAAVELAILLPFLAFLFVVAVDFARVFYYSLTIENCARNGALWASDPLGASKSPYANVNAAVEADAGSLQPALDSANISSTTGTDASNNAYVSVTVSYTFQTITTFPGVPNNVSITRTVQMRTLPRSPGNFSSP